MQGNMTYRKAKKLNAAFLLLLLATDQAEEGQTKGTGGSREVSHPTRSPEYFNDKLKEFERNKIRF